MMRIEASFGKRYYHLYQDVLAWLQKNLGKGGWRDYSGTSVVDWDFEIGFGNTFIRFMSSKDHERFMEEWASKIDIQTRSLLDI
jgi:hypothetical protein